MSQHGHRCERIIVNGGAQMPPMGPLLMAEEIDDLTKYAAAGLPK